MKQSNKSIIKGNHDMKENPNFNRRFLTFELDNLETPWIKTSTLDAKSLEVKEEYDI